MIDPKTPEEKLLAALKISQAEKKGPNVPPDFHIDTMRQIRNIGPHAQKGNGINIIERFFWHFTPVAATIILVLTISLYLIDFVPEYELASLYISDPVQFTLIQTIGF